MKQFFKSKKFKILSILVCALLLGMLFAAANGRGETAQSTVIGTVFAPLQKGATFVSNKLDSAFGNATGRKSYEDKIAALEQEVGDLQKDLIDLENIKRQNLLYKEFLQLKEEHTDYVFEEATVLSREKSDSFYAFTLAKGKLNGVQVGNPVIYGKYLVGIVIESYPTYALVRTILDPKFNAAAYESVSTETGYITGSLALARDGLTTMMGLKSSTTVTQGSLICTLGLGGVFPDGLILGKVTEMKSSDTDISSYAVIEPGVDVRALSDVFVITSFAGSSATTGATNE